MLNKVYKYLFGNFHIIYLLHISITDAVCEFNNTGILQYRFYNNEIRIFCLKYADIDNIFPANKLPYNSCRNFR